MEEELEQTTMATDEGGKSFVWFCERDWDESENNEGA